MHKHTHKMLSVATLQSTAWLETPTLTCTQHLTKIKSLTHHWAPCEWMNLFFCVLRCVCVCVSALNLNLYWIKLSPVRLPGCHCTQFPLMVLISMSKFQLQLTSEKMFQLKGLLSSAEWLDVFSFTHFTLLNFHFSVRQFQSWVLSFFSFFVNKAPQNHMRTYHLCDDMRSVVCYVRTQLLYKERLKAFFFIAEL